MNNFQSPNWQEAQQLPVYKRGLRFEEKISSSAKAGSSVLHKFLVGLYHFLKLSIVHTRFQTLTCLYLK